MVLVLYYCFLNWSVLENASIVLFAWDLVARWGLNRQDFLRWGGIGLEDAVERGSGDLSQEQT